MPELSNYEMWQLDNYGDILPVDPENENNSEEEQQRQAQWVNMQEERILWERECSDYN